MSPPYFAYGSNLLASRLEARVGPVHVLGTAVLAGFELAWNKPGQDGSGRANLRPRPGALCRGALYALRPDQWRVLDTFEPGYRREGHLVRGGDGREIEATLYRYETTSPDLAPHADYLRLVLEGAREHRLAAVCGADCVPCSARARSPRIRRCGSA